MQQLGHETLLHLAWKEFIPWLQTSFQKTLDAVLNNPSASQVLQFFEQFLNRFRDDNEGDLPQFWMSYLYMVHIMLSLIRASREWDWSLHLNTISTMRPWAFAYDKINYARYMPIYYAQMTHLTSNHPDFHSYFMSGGCSVQLGSLTL